MALVELDPAVCLLLLLAAAAYARSLVVLARRGARVPAGRKAAGWSAIALLVFALLGPPAALADQLMVAHMAEHVLMADLAAPLLLAGIRTPVLVFLAPRPLLVALARRRGLRRMGVIARRPPVALAVYVLVLGAWHLPVAFEAAVRDPLAHAFQHQSFVLTSVLIWWVVLRPDRAQRPARLWQTVHVLAARVPTMALAMAFVLMSLPAYGGVYDGALGLDALSDQQAAGALMLVADVALVGVWLALIVPAALREEPAPARAQPAADPPNHSSSARTFIGHEKK